jgi:hypothetical protein
MWDWLSLSRRRFSFRRRAFAHFWQVLSIDVRELILV